MDQWNVSSVRGLPASIAALLQPTCFSLIPRCSASRLPNSPQILFTDLRVAHSFGIQKMQPRLHTQMRHHAEEQERCGCAAAARCTGRIGVVMTLRGGKKVCVSSKTLPKNLPKIQRGAGDELLFSAGVQVTDARRRVTSHSTCHQHASRQFPS